MNNYLGAMADVILEHNGTIDEFIGDSVLGFFGAPIARPNDAARAVRCALAMQREMGRVNETNAREELSEIEMGIAVNTGDVIVGNIGSVKRAKYGAVGSHVNLVARIESFTVGGQVLISEATLREAGSEVDVGDEVAIRAKGFPRPVTAYDLRGIRGSSPLYLERPHVGDPRHRAREDAAAGIGLGFTPSASQMPASVIGDGRSGNSSVTTT